MLNEVDADVAVIESLAKAAQRQVQVREYGLISLLDDQSVKQVRLSATWSNSVQKARFALSRQRSRVRVPRSVVHRQNTPIIVLSAALGEAEAREAGANKFLHKPEDISSLVETISGLLSSAEDQKIRKIR